MDHKLNKNNTNSNLPDRNDSLNLMSPEVAQNSRGRPRGNALEFRVKMRPLRQATITSASDNTDITLYISYII
jgi:hypothetical protein